MIYTAFAYARAAIVGNPSDAYFGKTISFVIRNFKATVRLWESPHFEILPTQGDLTKFNTLDDFVRDLKLNGYYGGMRLIKAAVKRFSEYCQQSGRELHRKNFTIDLQSDIPRLVGFGASSAIVTATMRALMQFFEVDIPIHYLPTLSLSVEHDELGLDAGLQDRVVQAYEGIVYMDFDRAVMESRGYGNYEVLRPESAPPLYVAYDPERAQISDVPHRHLRALFNEGDKTIVGAMQKFRELTDRAKSALTKGGWPELGKVMNENFDLRRSITNISPENLRMVEAARSVGGSANFCGSGGAIVGLYHSARQYQELVDALGKVRCTVLRPLIFDT
jgi:glucuronokinase